MKKNIHNLSVMQYLCGLFENVFKANFIRDSTITTEERLEKLFNLKSIVLSISI